MPDAAWAIGLFGGIPAALIFLFWWIRRWDWRGRQLRRPYLHRLAETGSSGRGLVLPLTPLRNIPRWY